MKEVFAEIKTHLLANAVWLVWFGLLNWPRLVGLWPVGVGVVLGTFFVDLDHLFYWFFYHPEKQDSKIAKMLWQKKDFRGLLALLARYHDTHTRLIFHSALFQLILLVFSFYIFTSGGSLFVSGLVAALNIHLLKDAWQEYLEKKTDHLKDWLFWQIKRDFNEREVKWYLVGVTGTFLLISLLIR